MTMRFSFVAAILVFAFLTGTARVGPAAEATPQGPAAQQPNMQDMMKMHEQMMAEMKAGDAKLDALVKDMNAATGDTKITAVAAVVNELVRHQKAMYGRMAEMHQQMMGRGMMRR